MTLSYSQLGMGLKPKVDGRMGCCCVTIVTLPAIAMLPIATLTVQNAREEIRRATDAPRLA